METSLFFKTPFWGFPGGSEVKASAWNSGDLGLIPGSGRFSGEGNGNPLQYSYLENPMDRGAWWATVMGSQRVRQDSFCVETQDQTEANGVKTLWEGQIEKDLGAGAGQTHPSPT